MHFDNRLVAGMFIGIVMGLHYHAALVGYLPLIVIATLIMVLKVLPR